MLKGDWYIVLGVILGIIGIIGTSIIVRYGWELRKKELETMKGELKPPLIDFNKPFEVQLGGVHYITSIDELSTGINLRRALDLGYDYPFKIEFKDNKLFISAEIKDENLETIAIIEKNQWTVNENDIIARDRNYNDYAFEVIDAKLRPRLQVIVKEQNKIYIGGYFYSVKGTFLAVNGSTYINYPPESIKEYIQRIFEYPSETNLHKMVKTKS